MNIKELEKECSRCLGTGKMSVVTGEHGGSVPCPECNEREISMKGIEECTECFGTGVVSVQTKEHGASVPCPKCNDTKSFC